jgi:tRNA (cmo5U34)-methyltransferase
MANDDKHEPHIDGVWKFDESVTENFDAMLKASIPSYSEMRNLTYGLGKRFTSYPYSIIDLGASRGEAIAQFVESDSSSDYYALEISDPMLEVLRTRFSYNSDVHVLKTDLRQRDVFSKEPFLTNSSCLVLSVLTLQFVPIEYRQAILSNVYKTLIPGGAFLLVEKVLGNSAVLDDMLVDEYYAFKQRNGYSYEDIKRKKAALEGVLVPVTASWNESMLRMAGFNQVDCFFRNLNFAGFLAIKG